MVDVSQGMVCYLFNININNKNIFIILLGLFVPQTPRPIFLPGCKNTGQKNPFFR